MRVPPAKIHIPEEDRREILAHIDECLATGQLTLGKHGAAFEEAFAQTAGTKHAIAVSSGTSALEIIFRTIGVEGGEVIVPDEHVLRHARRRAARRRRRALRRVRSRRRTPSTWTTRAPLMNERRGRSSSCTSAASSRRASASCRAICADAGVPLIEDAAHAHGSTLDGKPAGSFGLAAAFSFYPTKVITSGEGGMIATTTSASTKKRGSTATRARPASRRTSTRGWATTGG